jgi:hypothetical protein
MSKFTFLYLVNIVFIPFLEWLKESTQVTEFLFVPNWIVAMIIFIIANEFSRRLRANLISALRFPKRYFEVMRKSQIKMNNLNERFEEIRKKVKERIEDVGGVIH